MLSRSQHHASHFGGALGMQTWLVWCPVLLPGTVLLWKEPWARGLDLSSQLTSPSFFLIKLRGNQIVISKVPSWSEKFGNSIASFTLNKFNAKCIEVPVNKADWFLSTNILQRASGLSSCPQEDPTIIRVCREKIIDHYFSDLSYV